MNPLFPLRRMPGSGSPRSGNALSKRALPKNRRSIGLLSIGVLSLALLSAAPAQAAPPSDAQIDQLMQAMNYERMKSEIVQQMSASAQGMAEAMGGTRLNPTQRESLQRSMDKMMARTDQMLSWQNVAPIYRKVYRETFEAGEVQALIDFYATAEGRSILEKMPRAMGRTMQEMQPLMKSMFEQIQKDLQKDIKDIAAEPPSATEPTPVIMDYGTGGKQQ